MYKTPYPENNNINNNDSIRTLAQTEQLPYLQILGLGTTIIYKQVVIISDGYICSRYYYKQNLAPSIRYPSVCIYL